jgi:hypothetical protein
MAERPFLHDRTLHFVPRGRDPDLQDPDLTRRVPDWALIVLGAAAFALLGVLGGVWLHI